MDLILREVPLQCGFALDAWNPMADCFIPKKEEVLLPDKMRTICLMDASYNMNNKWHGRAFMQHHEALGTLEDEQEGSRKEHNCPECVLKKVLCCDVMRQLRRAGFLCSNDAIQCCDRMVHATAMLSMMRLGADKLVLMSLFKQLQQVEHCIMTAQGIAEQFCGGKLRTEQGLLPFQGVMQGNGMGPIIWLAISMVLIFIMHQIGLVAVFTLAMSASKVEFCGFLIVDDADLLCNAPDNETTHEEMLPQFQAMVDCWERT
jgi:hypothetical protein